MQEEGLGAVQTPEDAPLHLGRRIETQRAQRSYLSQGEPTDLKREREA